MVQPLQHFRLDRIPDNLLREPLDFMIADHRRLRKVCHALDTLDVTSEVPLSKEITDVIFAYLSDDLLLHIADEEVDLFPAVLAAPGVGQDLADLISVLTRNHAIELSLASDVIIILRRSRPNADEHGKILQIARVLATFTECIRRHLAVEDDVLLPMARRHLTVTDLEKIGRAMAERRNIHYPH